MDVQIACQAQHVQSLGTMRGREGFLSKEAWPAEVVVVEAASGVGGSACAGGGGCVTTPGSPPLL
jgi:hypothetical protein